MRSREPWTISTTSRIDALAFEKANVPSRSLQLRVPTMTTFRFARTLLSATCVAVLLSGCCITSMKVRNCQEQCPCETQSDSGLLPIPSGAPPTFEEPPTPIPSSPIPPSPASAARDLGVKTTAMFRSAGDKVKGTFERMR